MALRIASDDLTAEISADGAELQRLTDLAGRDYLWDGDPHWWAGRAPILFPIVGTLAGGHYRWKGQDYQMARHGFARRSMFELVEHGPDAVTLRLEADMATRTVWPFAFSLEMTYRLHAATLTMSALVANHGDEPMPASFGFHPALRWPLPGAPSKAGHSIRFDQEEPAAIRSLDGEGLIDAVPRETPVEGDRLALDDRLFAQDALIFDRLKSRSLVYEGPGTARMIVDFPGMPHLGLWMKPGADFLCIEPWHGHSDPVNFDGTIDEKPGVALIAPRESRSFTMAITIG